MTENLAVTSNLSVAVANFYVDSSSTPVATQYLQDYNSAFSVSNPQWLYHATFSTSDLSNGAHTLRAEVRDVSGVPKGPALSYNASGVTSISQTFVVSGSTGSTCSITTTSLPSDTVGTAYSATLAQTGCGSGTWSISNGSLNSGLSLNASSGAITGTPTAAGTNNFTATYSTAVQSQALSITVNPASGGSCNSGTLNSTNGLYSDSLNCSPLGKWWTFSDPIGGSTASVGSSGPLTITVPSGTPHDAYTNSDQAALLTQPLTGNLDFTATANFSSTPNAAYQSEGIQAIADATHFVRCELLYTGSALVGYSSYISGTNVTNYPANALSVTAPFAIKFARSGNSWACSINGASVATFTQALSVAKVGLTADTGDAGGGAPAFAANVASFAIDGSSAPPTNPVLPGNPFGQLPLTVGPVTASSSFLPPGQVVTLTSTTPGTFSLVTGSSGTLTTVDTTHAYYSSPASVQPQHVMAGCSVGPSDTIFNTRIDTLPVNSNSATWTDTTTDRGAAYGHITSSSGLPFTFQ